MRHHYIPVFYLRLWVGADGRLCEFSRPYDRVVPKRKNPSATAYEEDLYAIDGLPDNERHWIEGEFLRQADQQANDALQFLLRNDLNMPHRLRSGWSRFIMSLLSRTPERINGFRTMLDEELTKRADEISREYDANHANDEVPPSPEQKAADIQLDRGLGAAKVLQNIMNSSRVGNRLNNMQWSIFNIPHFRRTLLTSDRPVTLTRGLQYPDCLLTLPISPTKLFGAANDQSILDQIQEMPPNDKTQLSNVTVVKSAIKYVFGTDDFQVNFVDKHLRHM